MCLRTHFFLLFGSLFLQREGAEDVLDFWLDVQQHENLCRAYFKDVRKSGRSIKEDWPQYWDYARRRGSIYGTVVGLSPTAKRSTASTGDHLNEQEKRELEMAGDEKNEGGGRLEVLAPRRRSCLIKPTLNMQTAT